MTFPQLINQYSLLWAALVLLAILSLVLLRNRPRGPDLIALGLIALALLAVWLATQPRQTPLMGDAAEIQAMIGQGKPVLLEFQSPF
jgi:hypothetical protein